MTSVAEGAAAPSEFQHLGAFFRNVVIISSLVGSALLGVSGYLQAVLPRTDVTGPPRSDWVSDLKFSFLVLVVFAVVQVMPRRDWRWVGLFAYVLAGLPAVVGLMGIGLFLRMVFFEAFRARYVPLPYLVSLILAVLGCTAASISWVYLGRYCRGWAREFAAANLPGSASAGNQESAQKETQ